jgi:putative transposase
MRRMGIETVYRKPRTSQRHPAHTVYPYPPAQRGDHPPEPCLGGGHHLHPDAARLRVFVRRPGLGESPGVGVRLSNTLTTDFCREAVQEALASYGTPEIFNTDQGCQFTSLEFTSLLKEHSIQISMDGTGCWRDNVFVERLWKSIKYEEVYLHAYETVSAAHQGLERYLTFYNQTRPHRALDGHTPDGVYFDNLPARRTAA